MLVKSPDILSWESRSELFYHALIMRHYLYRTLPEYQKAKNIKLSELLFSITEKIKITNYHLFGSKKQFIIDTYGNAHVKMSLSFWTCIHIVFKDYFKNHKLYLQLTGYIYWRSSWNYRRIIINQIHRLLFLMDRLITKLYKLFL